MPEPCKFPFLDSWQKKFMHPVVGLVLQVGDTEEFPHAFGFKSLDPFFRISNQGPCFTAVDEDGGDKRLEFALA